MSYSFLLKYIIIGDSGTSPPTQASAKAACSYSTPINGTGRNTR
jgi:hypothetical protein